MFKSFVKMTIIIYFNYFFMIVFHTDIYKREGEHTYLFTRRNRKYANGSRPDRAVGSFGFWKATAKDHPINNIDGTTIIGSKKTLVFYRGKPMKGIKTNWIMQEFTLKENNNRGSSSTYTTTLPSKVKLLTFHETSI